MPAALQILFEGVVFGLVSVFAAHLDEVSLAAHSIAINVVSTTYMVAAGHQLGGGGAGGQACWRRRRARAATRGWTAILLGALFMGGAGVLLGAAPRWNRPHLHPGCRGDRRRAAVLLRIAALFQLFDGLQVVATGALRGLGDTRTPMLAHLCGYWGVCLPVA